MGHYLQIILLPTGAFAFRYPPLESVNMLKRLSEGVGLEFNPELLSSLAPLITQGLISKLNHNAKNVFALQNQINGTIYVPCSCCTFLQKQIHPSCRHEQLRFADSCSVSSTSVQMPTTVT